MAALGGRLGATPADLLHQWDETGTGMISRGATDNMDRTIRFSMQRGVMESDPEALTLLAILSMLPAGTTGQNLHWWAPNLELHCDTLLTAALIELGDGPLESSTIFVLPTIQAYMAHGDRIPPEVREQVYAACYKFVLGHNAMDPDNPRFKADITALKSEQANIKDLLMQTDARAMRPNALDALIVFARFQSRTTPSTAIALYALKIAEESLHSNPSGADDRAAARRVAEAHMCLGRNLRILSRYDEAAKEFEVAAQSFRKLSGGHGDDLHRAGECSMVQAEAFMFNGEARERISIITKQAQADLSHDPDDKYYIARGLLAQGNLLWWSFGRDSWQVAIPILLSAADTFLHLESHASRGESLHCLARAHARLKDLPKALLNAQDGLLAAAESGDDHLTCNLSLLTAEYLLRCQRYDEAAGILEQQLSLSREIDSPSDIGQTLEMYGLNFAGQMNLWGARSAYAMAQEQFNKIPVDWFREGAERCANNLRILEGLSEMDEGSFLALTMPDWFD
ncbi:hypothetical protein K438DRAFT_1976012 [Mycena galopus ATCC 62051]|nr:hypothetical protein K438DRAFT_1976012 [Mycena galopus ATCC 62051]